MSAARSVLVPARVRTLLLRLLALVLFLAGTAHADAWVVDVPNLGPLALYGATPNAAVHDYVEGLVARHAFPGKARELRAWGKSLEDAPARTLAALHEGHTLSAIQLNSDADLLGSVEHLKTRRQFADGLARAGVASVFFPPADSAAHIDERLASIDHLTLVGGDDIHPSLYGQRRTFANEGELNLVRDRYEQALVKRALASKLPIDGTCRGYQMLNVVAGGTLVQDLRKDGLTTRPHAAPGFGVLRHSVRVLKDSAIGLTLGTYVRSVPSLHHEAVGNVGKGFEIVARSSDNVPEAIEADGGRVRGYQFHAEKAPRAAFSKAVFASIATRASAYRFR